MDQNISIFIFHVLGGTLPSTGPGDDLPAMAGAETQAGTLAPGADTVPRSNQLGATPPTTRTVESPVPADTSPCGSRRQAGTDGIPHHSPAEGSSEDQSLQQPTSEPVVHLHEPAASHAPRPRTRSQNGIVRPK